MCQCKPNVVGRQCDRCAPGTYGFGPEGCKQCDCNQIGALDRECDQITGQCRCRPNTYGRECDQCQPGYWNFNDCQQCQCNGHATTCDTRTGQCHDCADYTQGEQCDRCVEGYYGDPSLGSEVGCRPCHCPGTLASNHTHADECQWDPRTLDMVCYCREGYTGARCELCADNYFGNPEVPGGRCERCDCSRNVDLEVAGNCDGRTGECAQCMFETGGAHCEHCRDGYYGDALQPNCRQCECDVLGTNGTVKYCDRYSGQCPCLPNVEGARCDRCVKNHWKIALGVGCEACECDPVGALSEQCNEVRGGDSNSYSKLFEKLTMLCCSLSSKVIASARKDSVAASATSARRTTGAIRTKSVMVSTLDPAIEHRTPLQFPAFRHFQLATVTTTARPASSATAPPASASATWASVASSATSATAATWARHRTVRRAASASTIGT